MRTREEIALNFDVPILQYCELVKEAWNITKKDEEKAKGKKEKNEVFRVRLNIVSKFQSKIEEGAGELIYYCAVLISQNKDMLLDGFYKEMAGTTTDELLYREEDGTWMSCYKLFRSCYDKILFYEENERKGLCKYILSGQTVFRETTVNGETVSYVEASPINPNFALIEYCKYKEKYEYLLCHRLCDFICTKCRMGQWAQSLLAKLLLTVCLYIALQNEQDKLIILMDIFRDEFNQTPQTTTPAPQAQAKKKTKQPREVFTERATKYFEKAEKEGYLEKVGDKYEWLYRGGTVALVYFFIRIYEPESPPYEQLEPVFGVKNLTSSRSNLVNSTWYKDELKRQKMTSEELKLEERRQKLRKPSSWFPELKNFFD